MSHYELDAPKSHTAIGADVNTWFHLAILSLKDLRKSVRDATLESQDWMAAPLARLSDLEPHPWQGVGFPNSTPVYERLRHP